MVLGMSVVVPSVADLAAAIAGLDELDDLARAAAARAMARDIAKNLARVADAATYAATRRESAAKVAGRLGVSVSRVELAVTRHRALIAEAAAPARSR